MMRMKKAMSSSGDMIFKLAFALIAIAILSIALGPLLRQTPVVEVTDCSLTSDTIVNNGFTSISFTLKSNDKDNAHTVRVEFSSHPLVVFVLGSQNLPKANDVWYYTETLNPSSSHTQPIGVRASLESGIAKLAYRITVIFYLDDQQFYDKNFDLTVQKE